jgi:multidrug resistance efflux pump
MLGVYRVAVNYANCATKTNLLHTWQTATDQYTRTLALFSRRIGHAMSQEEYDRLHGAMQKARESSKQARRDFQEHIDEHHCGTARA